MKKKENFSLGLKFGFYFTVFQTWIVELCCAFMHMSSDWLS